MPASPESLRPSSSSPQIPSLRTGHGSQTHMQQSAAGNASSAGDQMWGTPRAWNGTRFPNSLQKPRPEHADVHAETTDVSGPAVSKIFPRIVASSVVLVLSRLNTATQRRPKVDLSHFYTITQISEPRPSNSMLHCPWAFTHPSTREKMRGYIPFRMIN